MIHATFQEMKKRRHLLGGAVFFLVFLAIYLMLDHLSGGYAALAADYGWPLVAANLVLDVVMAAGTAFLMTLSLAFAALSGHEGNGTILGAVAVFFGMLTYGCTPCVIAFFATFGIAFSVAVLPLAGLPYKLISLLLILLGVGVLLLEIRRGRCRPRKRRAVSAESDGTQVPPAAK